MSLRHIRMSKNHAEFGISIFWFSEILKSISVFVCSFVRTSVTFVKFASKFCVKVSHWNRVKVMRKQWTWTGAIRRRIPLSKPKWDINKITNRQNTTRTNGQPSRQLFPKRWSLSNPNRTKSRMNKHKVKHHRNSDTKNRQQRTISEPPPWNGQ